MKVSSYFIFLIDLLIEKRLGIKEEIILKSQSIIAFERSIRFKRVNKEINTLNKKQFIIAEGPGKHNSLLDRINNL